MMDIVRAVQQQYGCVPTDLMRVIAEQTGTHRVEVASVVSFYAFLSSRPKGKVVIRLCNDIIDRMAGAQEVERAFVDELGIAVGQTTADGTITLECTPCIGMCDQAPAAMVNDVIVTELTGDKARQIARSLKAHADPARLVRGYGDGNNGHALVQAMVQSWSEGLDCHGIFMTFFVVPFVLVGLAATILAGYLLIKLLNPRPILSVSADRTRPTTSPQSPPPRCRNSPFQPILNGSLRSSAM